MATFAFEISDKPNRHGAYVIYLRVTHNRKLKRHKTSVALQKHSNFNKKAKGDNWVRASDPDHAVYNEALRKELQKAQGIYRDLIDEGGVSSEKLISVIKSGERSQSFLEYAKKRTQEIYDEGGLRNYKKYKGFCNKLEAYLSSIHRKDVLFAEITPAFLSGFQTYLSKLPNQRQPEKTLHSNTIEVVFNIFKALVNRAIEIEDLMKIDKDPFIKFKYSGVKTVKEKLDKEEIQKIVDLELVPGKNMWHARNCFLFSFYCAGIRAGDLIQLRWCNITEDGRLRYQMDKTHSFRDLKLVPEAKAILSYYHKDNVKATDYIFPFADSSAPYAVAVTGEDLDTMPSALKQKLYNMISAKTALLNKYIKKVAEQAGIEKTVSMHIARHSFAKVAKSQGLDNALLKNMLGHTRIETTEIYMGDFDTSTTDKAMEKVFESKEDKAKKELIDILSSKSEEEIAEILKLVKG